MAHIVLGVCGGVAAYKSVEVLRLLRASGHRVSVIFTESTHHFVGEQTFAALSGEPVRKSLWNSPEPSPHTTLGQSADLIAVVPATARIISSCAHATSNDLLATTLIATRAPIVMAPAMHAEMWESPGVVRNVATLLADGVTLAGPAVGSLAGGDFGPGRMAEPDEIVSTILATLQRHSADQQLNNADLTGVSVLVTAGGTREPIDAVRVIANRSSGKQGIAIAQAAQRRGADVHLVTTVEAPAEIAQTRVNTANEMHRAISERFHNTDVVVMAAAVADFRVANQSQGKIKKESGTPTIVLEPTIDILGELGKTKSSSQLLVGFAAETNNAEANALKKLAAKNLDAIVLNDVSQPGVGFEGDSNTVTFFDSSGYSAQFSGEKPTVADQIVNEVARLIREQR